MVKDKNFTQKLCYREAGGLLYRGVVWRGALWQGVLKLGEALYSEGR